MDTPTSPTEVRQYRSAAYLFVFEGYMAGGYNSKEAMYRLFADRDFTTASGRKIKKGQKGGLVPCGPVINWFARAEHGDYNALVWVEPDEYLSFPERPRIEKL